ncbi:MAG: FkbM family methyltransferase, partial [Anaerolineae bacterium]|nr:FkbM family methyltransferase [Anaerolineae bacterium]
PPVVRKLRANLTENHVSNVTVVPLGLSNQTGTVPLFWHDDDTNEGQATFWANDASNVQQIIDTITVDELVRQQQLTQVNFIKIDVQGAEYQVLQGAQGTLSAFRPVLIFEYDWNWESAGVPFSAVQEYLARFGYVLYTISDSGRLLPIQQATAGEILALASD